jgi:hypothetical protein
MEINGSVVIEISFDITNLNGLIILTFIGQDLKIECNFSMISLSGLEGKLFVGKTLIYLKIPC